jgi:hypothetical protein
MLPDLHTRFCTLAYAPSHEFTTDPSLTPVLLVLQLQEGSLQLKTHPSLSEVVLPADLHSVQVLLQDFAERAQDDPESLFRQLASLSSGPLVTLSVGEDPLEDSQAKFMIQRFVEFEA